MLAAMIRDARFEQAADNFLLEMSSEQMAKVELRCRNRGWSSIEGKKIQTSSQIRTLTMEPKKEHTEHEENGTKVERTTYNDPDTNTHAEEIKIGKRTEDESEQEDRGREFSR
jgi:hypothetical protein